MKKNRDTFAQQARRTYVRQTGKIPPGTRVHHRHIQNLPTYSILDYIEATRVLAATGACHEEWGTKRMFALYDMLYAKRTVAEKRAAADRRRPWQRA